ncbi:MAG TPA: hypothetical protein VHL53_04775, partial [Acidimicrobiia bacterium]|nr:hypothetical protein [Acidimicrobiia bacterium]
TTSPTTAPSGVAGPKTAPPAKAPAPAGADPAPTTTTTAPAPAPDPGIDPASRLPTPPGREPATFTVSGNPAGTVRPGASAPIDLTIANPNGSDLTVTAVTIAVGPPSVPACGAGTLAVSRPFSGPVVVPAHTTRSLSALGIPQSQWPALTMPQSPVNQDACQQATFPITYTGTGTVA